MTPRLVAFTLWAFVGLTVVITPVIASPLQIGKTEMGSEWVHGAAGLLLVITLDQFAGDWKQYTGDLKQGWGVFAEDDLLYIERRDEKVEGRWYEGFGNETSEVQPRTGEVIPEP